MLERFSTQCGWAVPSQGFVPAWHVPPTQISSPLHTEESAQSASTVHSGVGVGEGLGDGAIDGFEDGMLVVGDDVGLVVGGGHSCRFVQKSVTVTVWRRHLSFFPPLHSLSLPDGHFSSDLLHLYSSCVNDDVQSCASVATLHVFVCSEKQVPHWGAVGAGGVVGTGADVGGTGVGSATRLPLS